MIDQVVYLPVFDETHLYECDVVRQQRGCWASTPDGPEAIACEACLIVLGSLT